MQKNVKKEFEFNTEFPVKIKELFDFKKEFLESPFNLVMLVDYGGSMEAFEGIEKQLLENLKKFCNKRVSAYYFYNVPVEYVYKVKSCAKHRELPELIQSFDENTIVLFFSDAGAARGGNYDGRVHPTIRVLFDIEEKTKSILWLNPMPRDRWAGTSAARIVQFVRMFDTNEQTKITNLIKATIDYERFWRENE